MIKKIINICLIILMLIGLLILTGCSKNKETKENNEIEVSDIYIEAFIYDNTSNENVQDVKKKIESTDKVVSVQYISKEEAYDRAVEKLGSEAMELTGYTKQIHPFPTLFIIEIKENVNAEKEVEEIRKYNIFKDVQINSKTAEDIYNSAF